MKHDPIRLHPLRCRCPDCCPPAIELRALLIWAVPTAIIVYGLLWAAWTMTP